MRKLGPWELSLLSRQEAVAAADPAAKEYVAALGRTLAAGLEAHTARQRPSWRARGSNHAP